jgi:2-methylfumaryl-CoA isomerase
VSSGILSGLRIIEAAAFVAAPLGAMTLAQLGAEVIRIDPPGGGLDYRRWPVTGENTSLFWCGLNKGKRSVCIDFTKPEGRQLAMSLITAPGADAGILLTNFPPRGWLSYEILSAQRADLIQLTIQGTRTGASAVDYTVNPTVGLPGITGPESSDQPVNHVLPAWDLITGQMAAVGLLAAERHRRLTGQGQHVRLALEDVALAMMGNLGFIAEAQLGQTRARSGNYLFGAFGRDFECRDGERVMVVGLTSKQWSALKEALALGEAMQAIERDLGIDLSLEGNRYLARQHIAKAVGERIAARSLEELRGLFDRSGVAWCRYQTLTELVSRDPACSEQNPIFRNIEQPGVGSMLAPTVPLDFERGGRRPPAAAPALGQDTDRVLGERLGLTETELQGLHERGVIARSSA